MAIATRPARPVESPQALPRHHLWEAMCKFIRTKPLGTAGAAIIVLMALAAVCADFIAPYDVYELNQQLQFAPPSLAHWLGTDEFGRDVLTRLIYSARIALFIGLASSFLGTTTGAVLGVLSAYLGGKTDLWLQRLMDILLAFPLLVLALAIVTVLGRSMPNLIVAIAMPVIPRTAASCVPVL
jgi:peptide/nickel transport system permease protein